MKRPSLRVLVLVVVAIALVGGGLWFRNAADDEPFADYCQAVEDHRAELGSALSAGDRIGLIRALPTFEALAAKAPDDLQDEWTIVVDRVTRMRDAFADAGVDPASYDPKKPPKDVAKGDLDAIETAAVRLGALESKEAFAGVSQQARDVCKTPLSL